MRRARRPLVVVLFVLVAAAALPPATRLARGAEPVPVMLKAPDVGLDPCAYGRVAGLKPVPGNFLSVRAGPGRDYAEKFRLGPGEFVYVCDHRPGWIGIIDVKGLDECRFPEDSATARPYQGPCRSGWVAERYIDLVAG